jgi:hypothetical protein
MRCGALRLRLRNRNDRHRVGCKHSGRRTRSGPSEDDVTSRIIIVISMCVTCAVGAQKSSPASGEAPDPCTLLSRLDVTEAVAAHVKDGVSRLRNGNVANCMFAGAHSGQMAILVRRTPSAEWVSEQAGRMSEGSLLGTYREVPQIGDRSFLYHMQGKGGVLCVYGADYYVQISLFRLGEDSRTAAVLRKLAGIAMARLRPQAPSATAPPDERLRLTTATSRPR